MSFSIDAVLKYLVEKFDADLTISRGLTSEETSCCTTLERILRETARNHSSNAAQNDEGQESAALVCSQDNSDSSDSEFPETAPTESRQWASIEETIAPHRLAKIFATYQKSDRGACLREHRITDSQLKAIKRHFATGKADQLKTREVRLHVLQEFTEVCEFIRLSFLQLQAAYS